MSRLTLLSAISMIALSACATQQENPFYKYSSKYKSPTTTTVAHVPTSIQAAPVSYQSASASTVQAGTYTRVNHECLRSEKKHELLGAGVGGTIGAIAGKKIIGGTKGTVIGAGLGGAAGYGVGDKLVDCDPETVVVQQPHSAPATYQQVSPSGYQVAPTAAGYRTVYQSGPVIAEPYLSPTDSKFETISQTGTPGYQVLQAQTAEVYQAPRSSAIGTVVTHGAQPVSYDYTANTIAASAATVAIPSETRLIGGSGYGSHLVKQGDTVYSLSRKLCVGVNDIQALNGLNANFGIKIGDQIKLPASNC